MWTEGPFDRHATGCNVSGESEPTMQQYEKERTFRLPSGEYKIFESHIKLANIRIHFWADNESRVVYIGYIGKHLPTWRFS